MSITRRRVDRSIGTRGTQNSGASIAAYIPICAAAAASVLVLGLKNASARIASTIFAGLTADEGFPLPRRPNKSARLAPNTAIRTTTRTCPMELDSNATWHKNPSPNMSSTACMRTKLIEARRRSSAYRFSLYEAAPEVISNH